MSFTRPPVLYPRVFCLISFLVSVLGLVVNASALDPKKVITQYVHQAWTEDDGLPQNSVQCITQTRDGYIWLGTEEGLVRFDGVRFAVFNKYNTRAFMHNNVQTLIEDRKGILWIGTFGGGIVHFNDNEWRGFGSREGLSNDQVLSIREDRLGNVWVGTANGLNKFTNGKLQILSALDGLCSGRILEIYEDHSGGIWIGTSEGLSRFENNRFSCNKDLSDIRVLALWGDRDGSLWVGTANGLNHLKDGKRTIYSTDDGLSNTAVTSLYGDHDGNLWIGTNGGGLQRFQQGTFSQFSEIHGLIGIKVWSLFEDREENLWVGTAGGGLNRFHDGKFLTYTTAEGLTGNAVWSIFEGKDGTVWIGTEGGGLTRLKNGIFSRFTPIDEYSNLIWSVYEDRQGGLWLGTPGDGLIHFKDGRSKIFNQQGGLSVNAVWSIFEDRTGNLWIGTFGVALNRLNGGKFQKYSAQDGLLNPFVHAIVEDPEGSLWIATEGGLNLFRNGRFTVYSVKDGLSSDSIMSLHVDSEGIVWIGTNGGGLNRLEQGKITSYTRKDGFCDDVIFQILEDFKGNLWMSSNNGIFRVKKQDLDQFDEGNIPAVPCTNFGKADGLESAETNGGYQPGACRTKDGRLWFPTIKGVAVIDPDNIPENKLVPPVVIEDVVVDNKPVARRPGKSSNLSLDPGKERIEFRYTALSFQAPEKVQFQYRLEGFDKNWVDAGTRRIAYYTNLAPGRYEFKVIASNNDGVWNRNGAALAVYLKPFFYQTTWFYTVCGVLVILAAVAANRLHVRHLRTRFSAVLAERTRIAREFHDTLAQTLAGLSARLAAISETMQHSPDLAQQNLIRARELAKKSLGETRRFVWDLRPQALENANLSTALREFVEEEMKDTHIQYLFQVHGTSVALPANFETNLLRIGQEAINNAKWHSGANQISVDLTFDSQDVRLCVKDDGHGFNPETASDTVRGHFGLTGMRERTEQMKGHFSVKSDSSQGTTILVEVPTNPKKY